MIRIMLVDDHTLVREALRVVLEREGDIVVVAEVGDGETALKMATQLSPDVVVMDVAMPGLSGIETTRRLLAARPQIKVLALSTYLDRHTVQQMLDAGAHGYIVKSAAGTELKQGIHSVMGGQCYLCAEVTALVTDGLRTRHYKHTDPDQRPLSRRELQIATLIAQGKSAPEIGAELHISPRTVEVHRRNLMGKLGFHSAVDLTKYAIRTGLIMP
jgi:two-component system NarL family response regulator